MRIFLKTIGKLFLTLYLLGTVYLVLIGNAVEPNDASLRLDFSLRGLGGITAFIFCLYFGIWCLRSLIENSTLWDWKKRNIFRPLDLSEWYKN